MRRDTYNIFLLIIFKIEEKTQIVGARENGRVIPYHRREVPTKRREWSRKDSPNVQMIPAHDVAIIKSSTIHPMGVSCGVILIRMAAGRHRLRAAKASTIRKSLQKKNPICVPIRVIPGSDGIHIRNA